LIATFRRRLQRLARNGEGAGLPDGSFSNQKSQFGQILEGLGMEKAGIFFGYFEYIKAIWHMVGPFGNLMAIWYLFPRFGILCQDKSGNPEKGGGGVASALYCKFLGFLPFIVARQQRGGHVVDPRTAAERQ
jgi:hypothetical protein